MFGIDPAVNALEQRIVTLPSQEAPQLMPSGVHSRLRALMARCCRGDKQLAGQRAHTATCWAAVGAKRGIWPPQPARGRAVSVPAGLLAA
jgi:threonine aldolase